jgi:hypothetical protein
MKQKYAGLPFLFDDEDHIIGIVNPDGTVFLFVLAVPVDQEPVDGVQATLETDMTAELADVTLTAVKYGAEGNLISITYEDPGANSSPLEVVVYGNDITVRLETDENGDIVTTGAEVVAALAADARAAALVTAVDEGDGSGAVNAVEKAYLTGGIDTTPGPVSCLCFDSENGIVYRKATSQTWVAVAEAPAEE